MPRLKIAWISDFPVEGIPSAPDEVKELPLYNATWQRVLLNEFTKRPEIELHILSVRKKHKQSLTFQWKGVTFHTLKIAGGVRAPSLFWADTLVIKSLLRKIAPDVVHAWGSELATGLIASRLGYPYIFTIQGLLIWYREQIPLNRYERFTAALENRSLAKAPVVTAESMFPVKFIQSKFPKLKVLHIEHSPDWSFYALKRSPHIKPVRFLFVGRFNYRKGGDLLVKALDQLKNEFHFELRILGGVDQEFRGSVEQNSSAEIWKVIQFRSHVSPAEVAAELTEATMMLFPTRADTGPIAVKEAVVAGVPVVGSALGGIVDYVVPGKNGFTFRPDSLPACIDAIRAACNHPLFSQGWVDEGTLAEKREHLSPERMADGFLKLYQSLSKRTDG